MSLNSGDYDMLIPHIGTLNWIESLKLTVTDSDWEPWYANNQVAGYKSTFARNNYSLVFATIKVRTLHMYIHAYVQTYIHANVRFTLCV